eukprot:scaffold136420_cov18-Tisochrysis_lutea.AAC.1
MTCCKHPGVCSPGVPAGPPSIEDYAGCRDGVLYPCMPTCARAGQSHKAITLQALRRGVAIMSARGLMEEEPVFATDVQFYGEPELIGGKTGREPREQFHVTLEVSWELSGHDALLNSPLLSRRLPMRQCAWRTYLAVGMMLATSPTAAREAAQAVRVVCQKPDKAPVLSIEQAIAADSMHPLAALMPFVPAGVLPNSVMVAS